MDKPLSLTADVFYGQALMPRVYNANADFCCAPLEKEIQTL